MTKNEMIKIVSQMDNDQQNSFYNRLRENGLTEDEIRTIQAAVFFDKLFSDPEMYKVVREEMATQLYKAFAN